MFLIHTKVQPLHMQRHYYVMRELFEVHNKIIHTQAMQRVYLILPDWGLLYMPLCIKWVLPRFNNMGADPEIFQGGWLLVL